VVIDGPYPYSPENEATTLVDRLFTNECNTRKCLRIILAFRHLIVTFLMTSSSRKYISETFVPFT
jgi:hypothetical protein